MLLEFRVRNFLSIRGEQAFTFAASSDRTREELSCAATDIRSAPRVLLSSVILGPSGAGKTAFIRALSFMRRAVAEGGSLDLEPSWGAEGEDSAFEIAFIAAGVRWQYGFAVQGGQVLDEHLLVYRAFKPQQWFWRGEDGEISFSSSFKGARARRGELAGPGELFLPAAWKAGAEQVAPVMEWFQYRLSAIACGSGADMAGAVLSRTVELLAACGYPVAAIYREGASLMVERTDGRTIALESAPQGLQDALRWAGPVARALAEGGVAAIDDFSAHQHALVTRTVMAMFHDPGVNRGRGQLLVTTHDVSLLAAPGLLRRDQVWLVDAGENGSELVSLVEYSPRKHDALDQRYLAGNYGALPQLAG